MGTRLHGMAVHLKRRIDHVHVADVCGDRWCAATVPVVRGPSLATTSVARTHRTSGRRRVECRAPPTASTGLAPRGPWGRALQELLAAPGRIRVRGRTRAAENATLAGGEQSSVLPGVDPAGGCGAPVVYVRHGVLDVITCLAAPQELQMHVGGQLGWIVHRSACGGQALCHELTAEGPLAHRSAGGPHPGALVGTRPKLEQVEQGAHATVPDSKSAASSASPSPRLVRNTSAVWSPSAGAATAFG